MSSRFLAPFVLAATFLFVPVAHAAPYGFPDPLNDANVPILINRIITATLGLVGALFFLMFLWGGFKYMTAGGDAGQVKAARTTLLNAVIGLIIIATAYAVVTFVIQNLAGAIAE